MAITKISGDLWKRSLEKVARDVQTLLRIIRCIIFYFVLLVAL